MTRSAHATATVLPSPRVRPREERARGGGRRASAAPVPRARSAFWLSTRLLVFLVCLALLGVGRVTLTFAVVQKNLQTDSVVREYRQLGVQNAQLEEQAAGLSSSLSVRSIAVKRYHLVVPARVEYVTVRTADSRKSAAQRP